MSVSRRDGSDGGGNNGDDQNSNKQTPAATAVGSGGRPMTAATGSEGHSTPNAYRKATVVGNEPPITSRSAGGKRSVFVAEQIVTQRHAAT
jgi:hypothetical protein